MKSIDQIYSEMMAAFTQRSGLEPGSGGDLAVRLYAVAAQVHALYLQAEWTQRQCFPQSATGQFLDYHAALRGVERKGAVRATGVLRFSVSGPSSAPLSVPAGTVCMTAGLIRFETLEDAVLKTGNTFVDVPAQAVSPGAAGNVAAGTILTMAVAPTGVAACSNPSAFSGGVDDENDDDLRVRILDTYRRLANGANAAFYYQQAMSFEEVAAATVEPRARGIGTVDVVIATAAGVPPQELLERVQSYFDEVREIAVDVSVLSPVPQSVNVSVKIQTADNYDQSSVVERVKNTVQSMFNGEFLGKNVLLAELGSVIFDVEGVENYSILSPAADITVSHQTLPVLGSIQVEVMD